MGKLKLAMNLLKLNNKLGLMDLGDVVTLASAAYKVKRFDPMDYVPEFDFMVDEEIERAERRKTILLAGAVAGATYLAYKNRDAIAEAIDQRKALAPEIEINVRTKGKKALEEAKEKGEDLVEKGKDLAEDAKDKGEELAEEAKKKAKDAKDKGEDLVEEAKDKGKDLGHDAAKKAEGLAKDAAKKSNKIAKDLED